MNTRKLTQEELYDLFNSPACDWTCSNGLGGRCAVGKVSHLISDIRGIALKLTEVTKLNDYGTLNVLREKNESANIESYTSSDPRYSKHERALKLAIQILINAGQIEIEDSLAQEFNLINNKQLQEVK